MGPTGHRCLLATVLLAQAAPRVAHAARFYVDAESGDDADDGSTPDLAVATITRGVELIAGGDELIVGPGTYYERPVFENLGSSEELPVWIRASPRGEAIISGMWEQAATGRVTWHEEGDGT